MAKKIVVVETEGARLDAFVAAEFKDYTRAFIKDLIEKGHVTVDGDRADPDQKVLEGQRIVLELPQSEGGEDFEDWVLFEDKRLLVLNKPSGLLMHPLGSTWLVSPEAARAQLETNLAALLQVHRPEILKAKTPRCGIVHRLDRPTSGVLVVAKDPETYTVMTEAFKERDIDKTYRAIVRGVPKGDSRVVAPIGRAPGHRRIVVTSLGKPAETSFKTIGKKKNAALVEAKPLTGRTHQIRAHLAYIGHPVAGDPEFDPRHSGEKAPPRMMLHAYRIRFDHPASGRPAEFTAEPSKDFATYWKSL
jgi:23S rRNA pseudouridine1911/1915/1917 synthase